MPFVSLKEVLPNAKDNKYAIPQFNINGYQWVEAILEVVKEEKKSVIIGVTDKNVEKLGGYSCIVNVITSFIKSSNLNAPVVLHLDHGQSVENCFKAIDAGFSSVMYDGSKEDLLTNITNTKKVVGYAQEKNISVEGELGSIGGVEDGMVGEIKFTNAKDAETFVKQTNVDALAPALGSVHGAYQKEPDLQFHIMKEISNVLDIPLVLHGASGLSESDIRKAIEYGHAKININTELNEAWIKSIRATLSDKTIMSDSHLVLKKSKDALKKVMKDKIDLLAT